MKGKSDGHIGLANRYAAWAVRRSPKVSGFTIPPEPRSIGLFIKGKQLVAGQLLFAGSLLDAPGQLIWDAKTSDAAFIAEAHSFVWLDDLAALGTPDALALAQKWTKAWLDRYSNGKGPGWVAHLTGRRLIRWMHHSILLISGQDLAFQDAYFTSLSRQTEFLARRIKSAKPGLNRFEAITGLLYAALFLRDKDQHLRTTIKLLEQECRSALLADGTIASRNPEELLEIASLLIWSMQALAQNNQPLPEILTQTIDQISPNLRVLRHSDGTLARFHGGGNGIFGRLDHALASSTAMHDVGHLQKAMGYWRLSGGRTSLVMDGANPPCGEMATRAHASLSAFELTSGRRPLIVNCGSGLPFGAEWQLAGRATQSHSALSLNGFSSSRFSSNADSGALTDCAKVIFHQEFQGDGALVQVAHDGWVSTHGLAARRDVHLSADGRRLTGVDQLYCPSPADRTRFEEHLKRNGQSSVPFSIRFHLHPDVDATLDMGGTAISMQLRSGEIWVLRHDGTGDLALQPSAYLEKGNIKPRPARQIILSCAAATFDTSISWTLAKAQDTPLAIRDLGYEDVAPI